VLDKLPGHYIRESYAYSSLVFEQLKKNAPVDFIYVQGLTGMKLLENKGQLNVPVGINFHGLEMFQQAAGFKSKLEQYLFRSPVVKAMKNADVVFSLGGKLTTLIESKQIPLKKIEQISIGIDASWIRQTPLKVNPKRKFVFVGRYERRKGIEELTSAIKDLLPEKPFVIEFIGAIPQEKQMNLQNVHYHGAISDAEKIKSILLEADVLICPSYSEGMPTVILEAMASGMCVIASDVGAVAELVDEKNGLLIPPGDVEALKRAINRLIAIEEHVLLEMKAVSVKRITDRFTWEQIIVKTIDSITKILQKK
jgi:glycosyltransferase involved in cell wall biosynthesis